jgi:hypothetical protein
MRASQILFVANRDDMPSASEMHTKYSHLSAETIRQAYQAAAEMRRLRAAMRETGQRELF